MITSEAVKDLERKKQETIAVNIYNSLIINRSKVTKRLLEDALDGRQTEGL